MREKNGFQLIILLLIIIFSSAFVIAQDSLSKNVDDFGYVHSILSKSKIHESKSEFETEEQYEKRISSPPDIKIGAKKLSDKFRFRWANYNSLSYNAETQTMKFELSRNIGSSGLSSGINTKTDESVTKEGKTAFGVSKEFTSTKSFIDNLIIQNKAQMTEYLSPSGTFIVGLKVPLAIAKEIKENAIILYEVNLVKPYFYQKIHTYDPTLSKPYENVITKRDLYVNVEKISIIDSRNGKELYEYVVKDKINKINITNLEKEISETKNTIKKVLPDLSKNSIYQKTTDEKNEDYFLRIRDFYQDKDFTLIKNLNDSYYTEYDKTLKIGAYELFEKDNVQLQGNVYSNISMSREMYEKIKDDLAIKVVGFPLKFEKKKASFFVRKMFIFDKNTGEVYN